VKPESEKPGSGKPNSEKLKTEVPKDEEVKKKAFNNLDSKTEGFKNEEFGDNDLQGEDDDTFGGSLLPPLEPTTSGPPSSTSSDYNDKFGRQGSMGSDPTDFVSASMLPSLESSQTQSQSPSSSHGQLKSPSSAWSSGSHYAASSSSDLMGAAFRAADSRLPYRWSAEESSRRSQLDSLLPLPENFEQGTLQHSGEYIQHRPGERPRSFPQRSEFNGAGIPPQDNSSGPNYDYNFDRSGSMNQSSFLPGNESNIGRVQSSDNFYVGAPKASRVHDGVDASSKGLFQPGRSQALPQEVGLSHGGDVQAASGTDESDDTEAESDSEHRMKNGGDAKPMRLSRSLSGYDTREDRLLVRLGSLVEGSEAAFYKLMSASRSGDAKQVRKSLELLSPESASQLNPMKDTASYGLSALHIASAVEVCRLLVEHGVDVDIRGLNGQTPLHTATHNDNLDIIRYLLDAGAEVDARTTYNGSTPLQWATAADNKRVVKALIRAGANVCFQNFSGNTALHLATSVEVAKYLVSKGARLDVSNNEGRLPLEEAASRATSDEEHRVALYLLELSRRRFRSQSNASRAEDSDQEQDGASSIYGSAESGRGTTYGSISSKSSIGSDSSSPESPDLAAKLRKRMIQQSARDKWLVLKRAFLTGRYTNPQNVERMQSGETLTDVISSRSSSFYEAFFNVIVIERPSLALKVLDQQRNFLHWENNARVYSYNISLLGSIPHSSFALKEMVFSNNADLISHRVVQFVLNARWTLFTREVVFFEFIIHVIFTSLIVYSVFTTYRVFPYHSLGIVWTNPSAHNVLAASNIVAHLALFVLNMRYIYIHIVQAQLAEVLGSDLPRWRAILHCKLRNEAFYILPHVSVFISQVLRAIPYQSTEGRSGPDAELITADVLCAVILPHMFYRGLGYGEGFESIGVPMATIRKMISRNTVYFMVLFTLITGFSLSMAILFKDEEDGHEYGSVGMAWINLFMFIFNLDVTTLNEDQIFWRKWFAFLVLSVYMVLVSLVVVNLLVAVMTNTYEEINQNSQAAWMMQKARLVLFYEHYELALNSILFSRTAAQIAEREGRYLPPGESNQYVREMADQTVEVELPRTYIEELASVRYHFATKLHWIRSKLFGLYLRFRGRKETFTWPKVQKRSGVRRSSSGGYYEPVQKEFGAALNEKSELQLITSFQAPRSSLDIFTHQSEQEQEKSLRKDIEQLTLSVKELILNNRRLEREIMLLRARSQSQPLVHGLARSSSSMPFPPREVGPADGLMKSASTSRDLPLPRRSRSPRQRVMFHPYHSQHS